MKKLDLKFLQKFQNKFAKSFDVGLVIVKDCKFVSTPTNLLFDADICKSEKSCFKSILNSQKSYIKQIFTCESNFSYFLIPIKFGGEILFHVLGGQVLYKYPSKKKIKSFSKMNEISEVEYEKFLKTKEILSSHKFKKISNFLEFSMNSQIDNFYIDLKTNKDSNENLLSEILSSCIENLEYKKLVHTIVSKTGKYFGADRCFFVEHDRSSTHNLPIKGYDQYLSSRAIKSHVKVFPSSKTTNFVQNTTKKNITIVEDINKIELPANTREMLVDVLSVKSYVIMPVYYKNIVYGGLVLHYVNNYRKFTESECNLIQAIANNFAVVIGQSELYSQLFEQISREKTVLENLPFAVWLKDKGGRYISVNDFFAKKYNKSVSEIIGEVDSSFMSPDMAKLRKQKDIEIIKGNKIFHDEIKSIEGDSVVWYEIYIAPFYNEKGVIAGTVGFSMDITEKKDIEKLKNEFISTVSHELRTPLTVIMGSIGLLLSGGLKSMPQKADEILAVANNNCSRLLKLLNDILDVSKIESGELEISYTQVELISLIENTLALNKQYADKFETKIVFKSSIKNVFVLSDSDRLVQLLTNLLSNAVKFSDKNSTVDVFAQKNGNYIRVSIRNYGKEIPSNFRNRIFGRFAQSDSSDTRKIGGTGWGLNISKMLIEKMNGKIGFESENKMTTFYVDIPVILSKKLHTCK